MVTILAANRWPFRLHATYNESIERFLNVFEEVHREVPIDQLGWFFDHAETVTDRNIERIRALGGGIAIQHRMAFQGEYFVDRYGAAAARRTPPIRRMLELGVPVGAETDATRVANYNPWNSLYWLVSGRTVGGLALYPDENRLSREEALQLYTQGSAWFSRDQERKGALSVGQFADLAVLTEDYLSVEEERIRGIQSVLTMMNGRIVYGSDDFSDLAPALPPVMPDWSPVARFGGYGAPGYYAPKNSSLAARAHSHRRVWQPLLAAQGNRAPTGTHRHLYPRGAMGIGLRLLRLLIPPPPAMRTTLEAPGTHGLKSD